MSDLEYEPILDESNRRFTLFPITYATLWELYKKQLASFWKAEEIDFSKDREDFESLSENEQHYIKRILGFFAASDGIVNFNLSTRFLNELVPMEATVCYTYQMMMENVHCVSGDTMILTDKGYYKIVDLFEKNVKVWNGKVFSDTKVKFTGKSQLYKVKLSNGMELDCTPEHKWFIRTGNQLHPEQCKKTIVFTKNLKENDVIFNYELPVMNTKDKDLFLNPYIHGFFCGDGSYCNGYPTITLYDEKTKLIDNFLLDDYKLNDNKIKFYITDKINKDKFYVPINYSLETKLKWLEGFCDSDGCVKFNQKKTATAIQLSNINYNFLKDIQLMLSTMNVNSNIKLMKEEGYNILPDGKGGSKPYKCQKCYVLYITLSSVKKLKDLGFCPKRLEIRVDDNLIEKKKLTKVISVTSIGEEMYDTYCFNEPLEHAGIFNGILTGQSESYSLMLDNLVKDSQEKSMLFNSIKTVDSIKSISDWAFKWIDSDLPFSYRVVAFCVVEGVFFSGAFASIFWLKRFKSNGRLFLSGLIKSNEFIARDEGQHVQFGVEIYKLLRNKLTTQQIYKIIDEGVEISRTFYSDALPVRLLGINEDSMMDYIMYVSDRLLVELGYDKKYNKQNPFAFMETIGMQSKTNFFESRPTEYQSAHVLGDKENKNDILEDDF